MPESHDEVDHLGLVLYVMITARRSFQGNTSAALFDAILNRVPTALVELNRKCPPEPERLINKLLEKDPDRRYQSAAGSRSDLKLFKRDSGLATPIDRNQPFRKPAGLVCGG